MTWIVVWIAVSVAMVVVQGALVQMACAFAGERPPQYGTALAASLIAGLVSGIATFAFGWTVGIVIGLFSRVLAWIATSLLGVAITAAVYRSRLRLPPFSAVQVAAIHHGLAWALGAAVWAVVRYWPF
jgi:hypothetical protein